MITADMFDGKFTQLTTFKISKSFVLNIYYQHVFI